MKILTRKQILKRKKRFRRRHTERLLKINVSLNYAEFAEAMGRMTKAAHELTRAIHGIKLHK